MLKLILSAGIASLLVCGASYAATPLASSQVAASDLVQIRQDGKDRGDWQRRGDDNWRDRHASRYGHDDRYRNWHRYAYRPDDWGDRGCISAGPIWYCP